MLGKVTVLLGFLSIAVAVRTVRAGTIWQWTHQASGQGSVHVFDGGPTEFGSGSTIGLDNADMSFFASDAPCPGSGCVDGLTGGDSQIGVNDQELEIFVDFFTDYSSGFASGADLLGGEGEGSLSSVFEFVMPVDELEWFTSLSIGDTSFYTGSTSVVVENVTQSTTLMELMDDELSITTLSGHTGDVIRITTELSGSGMVPPGFRGFYGYDATLFMNFSIPEPGSVWLLAMGVFVIVKKRRVSAMKPSHL